MRNQIAKTNIILIFLFCYFWGCSNNDSETLLPIAYHKKIEVKNFEYLNMPQELRGEIFNHTDFVLTRLVFRFELFKYDANSRLKQLFDNMKFKYNLGNFQDFAQKITQPQLQEEFLKYSDVSSLTELQNIVENFHQSSKPLLLTRKVELKVKIEPNFSESFNETLISNYSISNVFYDFNLEKTYGYHPN